VNKNYFHIPQIARFLVFSAVLLFGGSSHVWAQSPTDGRYKSLNTNGTTKEMGFYANGQKHKRWSYYNENGLLERKEKWENGALQWQIFYNAKGKITRSIDKKGKERVRPACGC
jgi:antitoxin component YwqK of YwqJK toxin-antitoxin module